MTALLEQTSAVPAPVATFASLGVPAPLVAVLDADGIAAPFPIQAATLPDALAGRDILGRAKTGSGKTLGFSLPMVARLAGGHTAAGQPRGLVLVPTRELATQVQLVLAPLARAMGLRVATIYGGVAYRPQINALQRGTDVLVACPGRLADLMEQGHCDLGDVEVTVIDEADQMADLGFLPIVRRLLGETRADGQRMLFSATLDSAIDVLARRFLNDPAHHWVDSSSTPAEIEHHVITIHPAHRLEILASLAGGDKRSLVFTRTKHGAERLARQLTTAGIPAAELHGNLSQAARARNLAAFGTGAVRVMVATDIAARGIHVDGVDLVIHADPPAEPKAYVHRSGRTARGGADGVVVTMQTKAQARDVGKLMREAGVSPHQADAEPDAEVLREIAGPPVPKVTLAVKVTELVNTAERLSPTGRSGGGRGDAGRPRGRKPRAERKAGTDRGRSDRGRADKGRADKGRADKGRADKGRADRGRGERGADAGRGYAHKARADQAGPQRAGVDAARPAAEDGASGARQDGTTGARRDGAPRYDRRPERFDRQHRADGRESRDQHGRFDGRQGSGRGDQFNGRDRSDQRDRRERFDERERPAGGERTWTDRNAQSRGERTAWSERSGRPGGEWAPSRRPGADQGASGRPPRRDGRPAGGKRAGAAARSGYSGSRTSPGNGPNRGQGRHF